MHYFPESDIWDAGSLSNSIFDRLVSLTDPGTTLRGLAPGSYRFKVFPDDLVLEPTELVLKPDAVAEEVPVRWRRR